MPDPAADTSSTPAGQPSAVWLPILGALTLFGWFVADASVRAIGGWGFAWFLFVFPLPYVGAFLLLTITGAVSSWPSAPARYAIAIGSLVLLVPMQAVLVAAGFMIGIELAIPLFALAGFLLNLSSLEAERTLSLTGLLAVCSTCALIGGVLGAAVFALQRRLGLFEPGRSRAWRIVDIGGGALAGALMLPAGKLLENIVLPRAASGDGLLLRLAIAGAIIVAIYTPHALAAWLHLRRSRRRTRVSWVGATGYAVILYLMPALLMADRMHRLELGWPQRHLEERQTALEAVVERTARAPALQAERERKRTIPSELIWHGLAWRAPAGGRLEGDWSPLEHRYKSLVLLPAEEHPLSRLGVPSVRVHEHAFQPVEIVPASRRRQIGYHKACRPDAWHGLTICWALGSRHARALSERFGRGSEEARFKTIERLPYGDFVGAAASPGFAASCRLDDGTCDGRLAHGDRSVWFQFPLQQIKSWRELRRELSALFEEATGRPLDDGASLIWRSPPPEG